MKIVFLQDLNPGTVQYFKEKVPGHDLVFPQTENVDEQAAAAAGADIVVGYRLPKKVADAAPDLKAFLTGAAGVDLTVVESLKGRPKVLVGNSHANSLDVAEHALALAMDTAKLIGRGDRDMRRGDWTLRYNDVGGQLLSGKTVLIVGYGAIGRAFAKLVAGFNMRVLGVRAKAARGERDDLGVETVALEEGLPVADLVLVFAPLTHRTKRMIGKGEFQAMKPTSILVNISRGPVVDEDALYQALRTGTIGGAGIDVWYQYPTSSDDVKHTAPGKHPFHELDNLVMSPHRASYTERMHTAQWDDVVENIHRIERGQGVKYAVDLSAGY